MTPPLPSAPPSPPPPPTPRRHGLQVILEPSVHERGKGFGQIRAGQSYNGMLVSMVPGCSLACLCLSTTPLSFPSGYGNGLPADQQLPFLSILNTVATVTLFQ